MLQFDFADPDTNESPEEVAWHNMREADYYYQLKYFIAGATCWMKLHPDKNYQDLERALREQKLDTHLIAVPPRLRSGFKLVGPNQLEYECIYSCRPYDLALKELLEHADSYEENFARLAKSGTIAIDGPLSEVRMLSDEEKDDMQLLIEAKKKLQVTEQSIEQVIESIHVQAIARLGKQPDMKLIGMGPTGQPVMGFVVDNQLVANVGLTFDTATQNKILVPLRN